MTGPLHSRTVWVGMLDDRGFHGEDQMADLVTVEGIGYKRRNPWGVFGLSLVTIGVYYVV